MKPKVILRQALDDPFLLSDVLGGDTGTPGALADLSLLGQEVCSVAHSGHRSARGLSAATPDSPANNGFEGRGNDHRASRKDVRFRGQSGPPDPPSNVR